MIKRYLFTVSYEGTNYSGFQRQSSVGSIQGEIEGALARMTRQNITIHSAGRTDKGVHAIAQTFHADLYIDIEIDKLIFGLNRRLPDDIIIKDAVLVDDEFHARHLVKERVYLYCVSKVPSTIFTQRFEVYEKEFNLDLAKKASEKFIGVKDFTGFFKTDPTKDPIRKIKSIEITESDTHYYFEFRGISFLRYMVRSIMGTIIDISTGKIELSVIDEIFKTKNRMLAGTTAPAKGLFLKEIIY